MLVGSLSLLRQGFISTEEFSGIPELSINPLHSRMGQMFNHVNFKVWFQPSVSQSAIFAGEMVFRSAESCVRLHMQEFAYALKASSKRASREDRLRTIFSLFDVDNDGILSPADLELMIRQLAGSSLL